MLVEHEEKLIDATTAFVAATPEDRVAFTKAYQDLLEAHHDYTVVALALMGDPSVNDHGAFSHDAQPTSVRAAFTIPDRGSLRGRMLRVFAASDPNEYVGWTDFELAYAFDRDPRTIGSCRRDLVLTGWVEEEGSVRFKPNDPKQKRPCIVWTMTDLGRKKYEELYGHE